MILQRVGTLNKLKMIPMLIEHYSLRNFTKNHALSIVVVFFNLDRYIQTERQQFQIGRAQYIINALLAQTSPGLTSSGVSLY